MQYFANIQRIELCYTGLEQGGIAETIAASIAAVPTELQGMFWAHIGLIGGNMMFPGIERRL